MRDTSCGKRSATHPSTKNVAVTPRSLNSPSRRSVFAAHAALESVPSISRHDPVEDADVKVVLHVDGHRVHDGRHFAPRRSQDGFHREEKDEQVERDREVLHVEEIVLKLLHRILDAGAVGVAHLRPPGHAGPHAVAKTVKRNRPTEALDELRTLRTRTNQAHVADEHVPQLRQFVEPGASEEATDGRDAPVVGRSPHGAGVRFGVGAHRAELVNHERPCPGAQRVSDGRRPGRQTSA